MTERPLRLLNHPDLRSSPDLLSKVLETVRLSGSLFFIMDVLQPFSAATVPAGVKLAPTLTPRAQNVVSYHAVIQGSCWAGLEGTPPQRLEQGDLVVFPHGDPYYLAFDQKIPPPAKVDESLRYLGAHQRGELPFRMQLTERCDVSFVCGFLGCDETPFNPVLASLPSVLIVKRADAVRGRLESLIDLALLESKRPQPGGADVRLRLSELMFIEAIRRHVAGLGEPRTGWAAASIDEIVGRALALLHKEPEKRWTLVELAKKSSVSRTVLAERFTKLVGFPPMQYLARWRMQVAAHRLAETGTKVSAVALEVGYDSEAAFSRAFKKLTGVTPVAWRERAQAA